MPPSPTCQVLITGAGIAGLWTLRRLLSAGYDAFLLEESAIGSGQTLGAQGILHGGVKYGLDGSSRAIADMLRAPRFDQVWMELLAYARDYGEGAAWTAWNLPFDRCMVRRTFLGVEDYVQICKKLGAPEELLRHSKHGWPERFDLDEDPLRWTECAMRAYSRRVRTKGHTRSWYTRELEPNSWSLAEAAKREGVEFTGEAHRALTDAVVAAKIYSKLLHGEVLGGD